MLSDPDFHGTATYENQFISGWENILLFFVSPDSETILNAISSFVSIMPWSAWIHYKIKCQSHSYEEKELKIAGLMTLMPRFFARIGKKNVCHNILLQALHEKRQIEIGKNVQLKRKTKFSFPFTFLGFSLFQWSILGVKSNFSEKMDKMKH